MPTVASAPGSDMQNNKKAPNLETFLLKHFDFFPFMWPRLESNADEALLVCMPTVASAPGSDMQNNKKVPCPETFYFIIVTFTFQCGLARTECRRSFACLHADRSVGTWI